MAWANDDIDSVILGLLPGIFTELKNSGDTLALQTIRVWPLQDDPTRVAPYVVFGPHPELGQQVRTDYGTEIGGPIMYWTWYRLTYGTAASLTRELARAAIGNLGNRLVRILQQNYSLGGALTPGGGEYISGNDPSKTVMKHVKDTFGGDAEFYGIGQIIFRYSFERSRNW